MIDTYECTNILNGKGEWGANLLPRALFDTEIEQNTCLQLNRQRKHIGRQGNTSETQETPTRSLFDYQLSQRKKRRRDQE